MRHPPGEEYTETQGDPQLLGWAEQCGNVRVSPTEVLRLTAIAQRSKPQKMTIPEATTEGR